MKYRDKTKEQLLDELVQAHQRIDELEKLENKLKSEEKQLKESEEMYRNIIEAAPDGIVTTDLKGMITSFNPSLLDHTGYSKDAFIGKHFSKNSYCTRERYSEICKSFEFSHSGKDSKAF